MEEGKSEFNVTGVSVKEFKGSSGVGSVTEKYSETDFNVVVDDKDADQLTEWVEAHGGEAKLV